MNRLFLGKSRCDNCGQIEYRYAKVVKMLSWLCNRLAMPDLMRENCELDSWWKDHQRSYQAELRREAQENEKKQEIKIALSKLTDREKELLKLQ